MLVPVLLTLAMASPSSDHLVFEGKEGPGKGKHVVLLAGDEEYRSEEMLPQLARILSEKHGFRCTVGFSLNERGEIDPDAQTRQSGLNALASADALVIMLRFRRWPDAEMRKFVDYYLSGKPIIALRTSTHAFDYPGDSESAYRRYGWNSREWPGGFGKQVLGETWVSHWGVHGGQATRGRSDVDHPIVKDVGDVFGPTDVYEVHLPEDAEVLMLGEVVNGMSSADGPAGGRKRTVKGVEQGLNDPMMPILWIRNPVNEAGRRNRILTCTMGAATDFLSEGFRRLMVNSVYWSLDLPVPSRANVSLIGDYRPSEFGFGGFRRGVKPADLSSSGMLP